MDFQYTQKYKCVHLKIEVGWIYAELGILSPCVHVKSYPQIPVEHQIRRTWLLMTGYIH